MHRSPTIVRDTATLATYQSNQSDWGSTFVPTMGALHEGHAALIRCAASIAREFAEQFDDPVANDLASASRERDRAIEVDDRKGDGISALKDAPVGTAARPPVILSIFVNPTQFAPGEDFSRYPRTFDQDVAIAAAAGAEVIFAPEVEEIYPCDRAVPTPPLPAVATTPRLEDAARPTHFAGVCQVVARLFDLVRPQWAIFGEKDYQQLRVIEAMVDSERPRWGSLAIVPHPTIRDDDGLALSSRNRYLAPEQRDVALALSRALQAACAAQQPETAEAIMRRTLEHHGLQVDYAVVRDAMTLLPVTSLDRPTRALIAARLGGVRLIDNRAMPVWR